MINDWYMGIFNIIPYLRGKLSFIQGKAEGASSIIYLSSGAKIFTKTIETI